MLWREAFFLNIDKSLVKTEKMNKIIQLKAKLNKYAKEDLFLYPNIENITPYMNMN